LLRSLSSGVCRCSDSEATVEVGNTTIKLENLTSVAGAFTIQDNPLLDTVLMPTLQTIGDAFTIKNNPSLKLLDGFSSLQTISRSIGLEGNFSVYVFHPSSPRLQLTED
jgi:hypothetical protein